MRVRLTVIERFRVSQRDAEFELLPIIKFDARHNEFNVQ